MPHLYGGGVELSGVPTGQTARVTGIDLDDGPRARLRELGLRSGGELTVTHRGAFGGLVVAVGADRFALDARTAARIRVTPPAVTAALPGARA